ncbi:MAG: Asp-tRNA(Asn)/Glu-tRNA(Gln) amidotransferase subunit GatC [Alphaproteobacteria bacterium]|nr:Asp-tRNA(Asn)/Glu-tRNA(Gln) amidotransferase subunit GatC [Alphaproteobacteria bacterium]
MSIDTATVAKVARLARLRLAPDELQKMAGEIAGILAWVEQLDALDTKAVEPMTSGTGQPLRRRPDVVDDGGQPDAILKNAPQATAGFFVVPKVVE